MNANLHIKPLFILIVACCISSVSFAQQPVLKHSYTFNDGIAKDSIGNADGLLKGGKIEAGKYITSEEDQYIELPPKLIKINTYTSLSLEAYIIAGQGNPESTTLLYFGNKNGIQGYDYIMLSPKNKGYTRSVISCKNKSTPWATSTITRSNALEDGQPHHLVVTFDNKVMKLFVDGLLVSTQTIEEFPNNLLENIGDELAYIGKSGYDRDPTWLGVIDAFNIYEGILDVETIEKSAHEYVPEQVLAVRSQLTNLDYTETLITQTRIGISLNEDWKYHSGDDSLWALKDYDDNNWPIVKPLFHVDSINGESWTGIGWFRQKFKIDSTLFNKAIAFTMRQYGASEIYLNGKLIKSNGEINSDNKKEKLYNPNYTPFIAVFDTSALQVLAIRYSNYKAHLFHKRYDEMAEMQGFILQIFNHEYAISRLIDQRISIYVEGMLCAIYLVLTILHLLLYLFYSRGKENLYYSIFTGSLALLMGGDYFFIVNTSITDIYYIINYLTEALLISIFSLYVFSLYAIFYAKMPRQFRIIFGLGTAIIFLNVAFKAAYWFQDYVVIPFILLLTIEALRVIILAVKRKKRNSYIIGLGVLIFFLFIVFVFIASIFSLATPVWIDYSTLFAAILSLPITMSIYLARENAKTKSDLENRIVEVQELSVKAVEHEKREAELRVENTRKEVELQKATELKSAYHNLEIAHENLKSTQSQLIQSEKMASLGQLTAGIAHEIQNPLNFVNNFSEVNTELIDELDEEAIKGNLEEVRAIAKDIKENEEKIILHGKRAESIVKGMLLHSRGNSGHKEPTDINALADEFLRLSYHGFRAKDKSFNAEYKTEFDPNLPKINVVPQDIGRVLLNLINNAFYAVDKKTKEEHPLPPKGGSEEMVIEYKPMIIVSTIISKSPSGDLGVKVVVKDNGPGIPDSIKDKIFQPFFTTKPAGQGTGLGLSLAYDIVKAHGGEIKVVTKEGVGTEFIIQIPV